jgi:hypothetical protein
MISHYSIKVIKRAERQRPEPPTAESRSPELSRRDTARALAARVKEWVSELEQARPVRLQELKRRLGWPESGGDGLTVQAVSDPVESER